MVRAINQGAQTLRFAIFFASVASLACLAGAGSKTENNVTLLQTASGAQDFSFVKVSHPNLVNACKGDWALMPSKALTATVLTALAMGNNANMMTIETTASSYAVYDELGVHNSTCRIEWIEFNAP